MRHVGGGGQHHRAGFHPPHGTSLASTIEGLWHKCRIFKIFGAKTALASGDDALWAYPTRLVEAARLHDGREAAAATRESLLSARSRIESFMSDPPPAG